MLISEKRKIAAKANRQKKIREHFNAYKEGHEIYASIEGKKLKRYAIVGKKEYEEDFFIVVQNREGRVLLTKLVYSAGVKFIKITRTSNYFAENKEIFDSLIKQVKTKMREEIERYYENTNKKYSPIAVWENKRKSSGYKMLKYITKNKIKNKYYFILRTEDSQYIVARVYWYCYPYIARLSEKELEKNKSVFEAWIHEAKTGKKKKST